MCREILGGLDMHSFLCVANLGELRSTLGIQNVNPNKATDLIVPLAETKEGYYHSCTSLFDSST